MKGKKLSHAFAPRIKKIMQADDDVGKIAQASPVLLGRALELFLARLSEGMVAVAAERHHRVLNPAHLKAYVNTDDVMDFLRQTVASAPDLAQEAAKEGKQKPKRRRKTEGDDGAASPKAPKARARASKAKAKPEQQVAVADEGSQEEGDPGKMPPGKDVGDAGAVKAEKIEGVLQEAAGAQAKPSPRTLSESSHVAPPQAASQVIRNSVKQGIRAGAATVPTPHTVHLPVPPSAALEEEDDYDAFD